jgi:hypothetical protein
VRTTSALMNTVRLTSRLTDRCHGKVTGIVHQPRWRMRDETTASVLSFAVVYVSHVPRRTAMF